MPGKQFDHEGIVQRWLAKQSPDAIAEQEGCSVDTVRYVLGKQGIKVTIPARVARLAAEGLDVQQIAAHLGRSQRYVQRIVDRDGVQVMAAGVDREQILAFLRDGCPYTEVGRTFGVDVDWLKEMFPGYGLSEKDRDCWGAIRKRFKLWIMYQEIEQMGGVFA